MLVKSNLLLLKLKNIGLFVTPKLELDYQKQIYEKERKGDCKYFGQPPELTPVGKTNRIFFKTTQTKKKLLLISCVFLK